MPVQPTYPGVYIEEVPSGVRTIVGVPTSVTAFVGRARRGPVDDPIVIHSFAEFEREFGGLWADSTMSYAVQQYYLNGGVDAVVVRVVGPGAAAATIDLPGPAGALTLTAASPGLWGDKLRASVDHDVGEPLDVSTFNLFVEETRTVPSIKPGDPPREVVVSREEFRNVSFDATHRRYVRSVVAAESRLVRVAGDADVGGDRPEATPVDPASDPPGMPQYEPIADPGADGGDISADEVVGASDPTFRADKRGLYALEDADIFNLLCIPPFTREDDLGDAVLTGALGYCAERRAVFLVDAPKDWNRPDQVTNATGLAEMEAAGLRHPNAALYFPRILVRDPLRENRLEEFAPSGAVAGVIARTDAQRGVWKAPAGLEATIVGAQRLEYVLTDGENGVLNPLGVNCLRTFPVVGTVVWGARTMRGADRLASEWKYLPVRRLALFIEESLYRGTQWAVFEPNDEPLWAQIRLNVGAFMHRLFRQGAFAGSSARDAYLVKCDAETTPQEDINLGIVNVIVGFRPLIPAEFVIIKIQQLAGQTAA